jgi:hypothetical protein
MNNILWKGKIEGRNSSLRNLKIMLRNLNEIVLSWIPSLFMPLESWLSPVLHNSKSLKHKSTKSTSQSRLCF